MLTVIIHEPQLLLLEYGKLDVIKSADGVQEEHCRAEDNAQSIAGAAAGGAVWQSVNNPPMLTY